MVSDEALATLRSESARAIQKHGLAMTTRNPEQDRFWKLSVLMEEIGEVSKALNEYALGNITKGELRSSLRKELGQVGATAALWIDAEDER